MATETAREEATKAAQSRAMSNASDLQKKAEALSTITTLRISDHMQDMRTVEQRFVDLKVAEEKKEINSARGQAEIIQAEAKARAPQNPKTPCGQMKF